MGIDLSKGFVALNKPNVRVCLTRTHGVAMRGLIDKIE